jgi:hypothetical protein
MENPPLSPLEAVSSFSASPPLIKNSEFFKNSEF